VIKIKHRVIIIHGSYGGPSENWFPWLAHEVRRHGHEAVVPAFPTPAGQSLATWQAIFRREFGEIAPDMVLVGHSLGAGFILDLLEEAEQPVAGTFLVSGFVGSLGLDEFDLVNQTFVCRNFQWQRISRNAGDAHVYNSDNDPYVPLAKGQEIADRLGVTLTVVSNGGHINTSAGFSAFPLLLQDLTTLLA